ncbi:alpha/beta fold hydrolase [Streptomyces mirabilis]|uniref:alpha/beta fold hydrolase n=1 Tax=Streptomyces mirabilis TaxID=68239 RepID=UPI0033278C25
MVYLNGQFATQGYWRRVIAQLGTGWRHITYDERARGRSKRSADYSFEAAVRDIDAVLAARGVHRALAVGWSYGAVLGAHWTSRARSPTTGSTTPWNNASARCSDGWAGSCRCCARRAWPRG